MIIEIYRVGMLGIARDELIRVYDEYPVAALHVGDQMIVWDGYENTYIGTIESKIHDLTKNKVKIYLRGMSKYTPPKGEYDDEEDSGWY